MNEALIIFVKNPEPGKVKTRIAHTMGNENATLIYKELLDHTKKVTQLLSCKKFVFYGDNINQNDLWDNDSYHKVVQHGNDLGERMKNSFDFVFKKGYDAVCIIGSDCMELSDSIIKSAFYALNKNDIVIGPSTDGGYYLLGMKQINEALFLDKNWSTEEVLTQTIIDIKKLNKTYQLLELITDIDTEQDWQNFLSKKSTNKI